MKFNVEEKAGGRESQLLEGQDYASTSKNL